MLQDVSKNEDVLVTEIDQEAMKEDFKKIEDKLKVPADQVYYPKREDVKYTIGSQWKQRYLVQKDGKYYIAPTQFNIDSGVWVNYHEADWDQRPWLQKCGGCHATGVDLDKETFLEPGVGCEACHGPGEAHVGWARALGDATGQTPVLAGSGSTWFVPGAHPGPDRVVVRTVPADAGADAGAAVPG